MFVVIVLGITSGAHAGEAEDKVFSLTSGIKARYLGDTGDLKLLALDLESRVGEFVGSSSKCTKRRARDLSRAYREVLVAVAGTDAKAIYDAARNLNFQAHQRSTMFTRCWNHMRSQAKALGDIFEVGTQVIAVGAEAGW